MNNKQSKPEKIIMGIDPGTNLMGYALLSVCGNKAEMIAFGVIRLGRYPTHYLKLGKIYERVSGIINEYHPDELAIEAPFFGKNVQSMLKLGRAQGVAICAAIQHEIPITEYEPRKIKVAITGNGAASKEQVATMLQKMLKISDEIMTIQLDATDALAVSYCHFLQMGRPESSAKQTSWKEFIKQNQDRIKKGI